MPPSLVLAGLAIVTGVIIVLLCASPGWIRAALRTSVSAVGAVGSVRLSGSNVAGANVPLALVSGAGLVALALVRTLARRVLAVFIAAAAIGILVSVVRVLADPEGIARGSSKVKTAGELASAHLSATPFIALIGGLLILAGAIVAIFSCGRWPTPASRYERVNAQASRPKDTWDALERGEDPTSG